MKKIALSKTELSSLLNFAKSDKIRSESAVALSSLGLDFKKTEHYRYFNVSYLLSKELDIYETKKDQIKEDENILILDGSVVGAPKDIKIDILDEIDLDKNHFDQIYYINHILSSKVINITVTKDSILNIKHKFTVDNVLLPYRISLNIKNGAKVAIYEDFEYELKNSLIFYGWDIFIDDGFLEYVRVQDEFEKSYDMVASHNILVNDRCEFVYKTFDIGEGKISHNTKIDLFQNSRCEAKHLVYTDNEAVRSNVIKINHLKENATSNQEARHVLKDRSTAIFDALIKVENSAKGASAHQNNKSILLNDKAYMVSKPQLEIYIDELEASHGSTTGQIDPEEIFYIRTRGIEEKEARKMIVLGFMNEIIESIKEEDKKSDIYKRFEDIYNRDTN